MKTVTHGCDCALVGIPVSPLLLVRCDVYHQLILLNLTREPYATRICKVYCLEKSFYIKNQLLGKVFVRVVKTETTF